MMKLNGKPITMKKISEMCQNISDAGAKEVIDSIQALYSDQDAEYVYTILGKIER
jgi:ribulose bisphosphate carboxylase small subunit